jgi:hypothetical protein
MTVQMITSVITQGYIGDSFPYHQVPVDIVEPAAQVSANAEALLAGSEMDMRAWRSLSYTVANADAVNTIQYAIYGANASSYADEVVIQALTDVAPAAAGSYSVAQAPFSYYRVKIHSKVDDAHGSVTARGIAKG